MSTATSEILDRVPPHDLEAEKAVLASVILKPSNLLEVAEALEPTDFHIQPHHTIYQHLLDMADEGIDVGTDSLVLRLREAGDMEAIGGAAYLAEVLQGTATPSQVAYPLAIVARVSKQRELIHAAVDVLQDAYRDDLTPEQIVLQAMERLTAVVHHGDRMAVNTTETFARVLAQAESGSDRPMGLPTGFGGYDERIGGLYAGELVVLAARPSMGKTAMATQIMMHSADRGRDVLFVSLEMSAESLARRVLCSRAEVDAGRFRTGHLTDDDRKALGESSADLPVDRIHIVDRPSVSVLDIRWAAKRCQQGHGLDLLVVDYLTRLSPADRRVRRWEAVGQMSGDLKRLALELDVPVLCLAQLNRQAETEARPRLSHLRESGDIEADADVVCFLHRQERQDRDDVDVRGQAQLFVEKNRNGPCGEFQLQFNGPTMTFSEPDIFGRDW